MSYKICVYAICKNESKFISSWLDNMSEADYIVVLDTGSTDNTVELLKNDSRVTRVEQKIIKPWRFDVARNESMKLVPEDTDILVCTDFDELFEPGWATVLRDNWKDEYSRCWYKYAWSHFENGLPDTIFKYDKIHRKDYHWIFPVHEVIIPNNESEVEHVLDALNAIFLHHYRDLDKPRSYYFDLLKLSVKENPKESHCCLLLAREYYLNSDFENAYKYYKKCLDYEDIHDESKKLVYYESLLRLGDTSWCLGNISESFKWYNEAIMTDNTYEEPYLCMADIYLGAGQYELAKSILNTMPKITHQHFDWVERSGNYLYKRLHILGLVEYELGDYELAAKNLKIAKEYEPDNKEIIDKYMDSVERLLNSCGFDF